ncbi:hypothetical protein LINPERPRIM_LOCUS10204 [Linum perenne]
MFQFLPSLIIANRVDNPVAFPPSSSLLSSSQILPPNDLQAEVCKKAETINYKTCLEIIQSDPQASFVAADIKTLAGILLQGVKEESTALGQMFEGILRDPRNPKNWKPALKMCAQDYKDAAIFFNSRGLGDMSKSLEIHSALDNSQNCESEMAKSGMKVDKSVEAEIQKWKNLYAVANGAVLCAEDVYGGASSDGYGHDY